MRANVTPFVLFSLFLLTRGWAATQATPAASSSAFKIAPNESKSDESKFTPAQLAFVQSWIKQKASECPMEASPVVAELFLEELQQRSPDKFRLLLATDFPQVAFESMLLRHVGAKLTGANQAPQREKVAERRVAALLVAGGRDLRAAGAEAGTMIAKIRDGSPVQYRRLVEGKLEDDDLQLALKKATQDGNAQKEPAIVKPKVLSAADIISEFSRKNQVGSALQRLNAYVVQAKLKSATGEEQELLLFKMRPDRFRLVLRSAGLTRYLLAGDGERFWQQAPGQAPQMVPASALGNRRYLAEFADPLFVGEGFTYERLPDGVEGGKKCFRISVRRSDGSGFVAYIDSESYREILRENEDHSSTRYSDFRDVAGVIYAFHEEVTDQAGRKGTLDLVRLTPNPGLIQSFFEVPNRQDLGYFEVEQLLAPIAASAGKSH